MKILIIKLGLSETLDSETSKIVSLGDVVRCTVVLEPLKKKYENPHITWVVSKEAQELVKNNALIDRVLVWDEFVPFVLMREKYDIVINLEKIDGICALTDMINAWEKIGFRFDEIDGKYDTYFQSVRAKEYIQNKETHKQIWQQVILNMLGIEWKDQKYSLGYKPKTEEIRRVGLNYLVGSKWPSKAMSKFKWEELEKRLEDRNIPYSWQEGKNNLLDYIEWINSCKVIVTQDSLGLHLALALDKYVICLFGPTSADEIYFYGKGLALNLSEQFECKYCYSPICTNNEFCMDSLDLQKLIDTIETYMDK
ncbi:glycosyltransferase family 9 protein [Sulfurimonas sp. HSL-1716]|uniref:glycosyltransferase family 9 protein n=1 Tax=Hydrocurvibacter sulfurireducens TaxID=3131937 RepID=UPI0031F8CBA6